MKKIFILFFLIINSKIYCSISKEQAENRRLYVDLFYTLKPTINENELKQQSAQLKDTDSDVIKKTIFFKQLILDLPEEKEDLSGPYLKVIIQAMQSAKLTPSSFGFFLLPDSNYNIKEKEVFFYPDS